MLLSDLMPNLNASRALVLGYIFEVPHIILKFGTYVCNAPQRPKFAFSKRM